MSDNLTNIHWGGSISAEEFDRIVSIADVAVRSAGHQR